MSEQSKHTPGPWVIDGNGIFALQHAGWDKGVERLCNRLMCSVYGFKMPDEELAADIQLIAAAPELLALLKEVWPIAQAHIEEYAPEEYDPTAKRVEAVIAKAEGR